MIQHSPVMPRAASGMILDAMQAKHVPDLPSISATFVIKQRGNGCMSARLALAPSVRHSNCLKVTGFNVEPLWPPHQWRPGTIFEAKMN